MLSRRIIVPVAAFVLSLHVLAGPAFAQKPVKPPGDEGATLQWVIALGIMIVIGISAFMNPKRSHRA